MEIDNTTYNKARAYPSGHGYDHRSGPPVSILVHATHGRPGSSLRSEATYLMHSADVSAHYLVGKAGEVIELLAPMWRAWHAGRCRLPFGNDDSIGIELHAAVTDPITPAQRLALTDLVRLLMGRYRIPASNIETHRAAALPKGRKSDPATWSQLDFAAWRQTLGAGTTRYRLRYTAWVRKEPRLRSPRVGDLLRGAEFDATTVRGDRVAHAALGDSDEWLALSDGGYVWSKQAEAL